MSSATMCNYSARAFHGLDQFVLARDSLVAGSESLGQLGDVVCRHGLHNCVGVTLLHKHFDISDDEVVVREFQGDNAYISPRKAPLPDLTLPYLWRARTHESGTAYAPLEFCTYPGQDLHDLALGDVQRLEGSTAFLIAFAAKLAELRLLDVFGLMALRPRAAQPLRDGQTLLETTDEERRVLTLEPAWKSDVDALATTQTLWMFSPAAVSFGDSTTGTNCAAHCTAHCLAHCTTHGLTQEEKK